MDKYDLKGVSEGNWTQVSVWFDGIILYPERSQKIINHSPDGFSWGYSGSGPSQLALAVMHKLYGNAEDAVIEYHKFRNEVIAQLPQNERFSIRFWWTPEGWVYEYVS